jgi:NitT/TauT family transport system permease protein
MAERLAERMAPPVRPEFVLATAADDQVTMGEIARPLSWWERLSNRPAFRRIATLVPLVLGWEIYARIIDNPLLLPTFGATAQAFYDALVHGNLLPRTLTSLRVLLMGYAIGVALAAVLTIIAVTTRFGTDLLSTLTAMLNPLPAIALLPLALLWFGLGIPSMLFVIVHSVLWVVALNAHTGFMGVSETLRMVGQNYGMRGLRYVLLILIPAAFPAILTGLKIGWAFAWRTLIAAELVFGVAASQGGLGWFIFEYRNQLETAYVFAGLTMVIIIGLLVESVIFRNIELMTVQRWGMQR